MADKPKRYPSRRELREAKREAQRARATAPTTRSSRPIHPGTGRSETPKKANPTPEHKPKTTRSRGSSARPPRKKRPSKPALTPKQRRRRIIKRTIGVTAGLFLLGMIGGLGLFITAYAVMDIPSPAEAAQAEVTTVYYGDGETTMGTFASQNRTIVDTSTLPPYVGEAIIASEDRTFFENSGVDLRGMARALWNNVRGRPLQGGSTLSQQYVENYYLGTNKTYWGKFKETILALKINREQSKDEILGNYMNTIFFGRSAFGIEAAAHAYFDKPASELTISESALLSGIIPAPTNYDPRANLDIAKTRWNRVLDNMVADQWITQEERDKQEFPETIEYTQKSSDYTGSKGYLLTHVRSELAASAGYSEAELDTRGLKIYTTIDVDKQKMAEDAVARLPEHQQNLRTALVSIDSATGAIVAEYGGADYEKIQRSAAFQDQAMAGSTYKPFALVAALEAGMNPNSTIDGSSPLMVNGEKVNNVDHSYGTISLAQAAKYSVNTAFVRLVDQVGVDATRQVAIAAGYPKDTTGLDAQTPVSVLGTASPHTINIAEAYTTFATGGINRPAHIVSKVTDSAGNVLYEADTHGSRVFDENTMANLNSILQGVVNGGTAKKASALGRPVAAKTGSSENLRSAQFVGYIPQMVTAVSMYQVGDDGSEETISGFGGVDTVYGGTWPAQVWEWYMEKATEGMSVEKFPDPETAIENVAPKTKEPTFDAPSVPTPEPTTTMPTTTPTLPKQTNDSSNPAAPGASTSPSPSASENTRQH